MTKAEERNDCEGEFQSNKSQINHPSYYNQGIEAIDFIDSHSLNFLLGNTIKYIIRAGLKDGEPTLEALEKAEWYLSHEIERLKKKAASLPVVEVFSK